jgi:hypothetical protein
LEWIKKRAFEIESPLMNEMILLFGGGRLEMRLAEAIYPVLKCEFLRG